MIDRTHRFQGHGSLRFVYQRGKVVRGPFSSLKYIRNTRRGTYRLAVVVSRKVHKSAVVRNRIRRRLYEVVRSQQPRISQAYDLVITVYSDQFCVMPAADVRATILQQLEKAGVLDSQTPHNSGGRAIVEPKES